MAELEVMRARYSLPMRAARHWHLDGSPVTATRRVREDFLPTWNSIADQAVLTMEPYAFPAARDLFFIRDPKQMTRSHWGLVADLANLLQARTHLLATSQLIPEVISQWYEPPSQVVVAEILADTSFLVEVYQPEHPGGFDGHSAVAPVLNRPDSSTIVVSEGAPQFAQVQQNAWELAQTDPDVFLFTAQGDVPEFLRIAALPETAEAKRVISQRVWGEFETGSAATGSAATGSAATGSAATNDNGTNDDQAKPREGHHG